MKVLYDESRKLFMLNTPACTYAFCVTEYGILHNLHWGGRIEAFSDLDDEIQRVNAAVGDPKEQRNALREEYAGQVPYCEPEDLFVCFADGTRGVRLVYDRHVMTEDTLKVWLKDSFYPLEVELSYSGWGDLDLLRRGVVIRCTDPREAIQVERAFSATLNLPGKEYRLTYYAGEWGAEYTRKQVAVDERKIVLEKHSLTRSADRYVPFAALDPEGKSTETAGEVFYAALQWSGEMKISVERSFMGKVTATLGMNDYDFRWELTQDRPLELPDVVFGYTPDGFEEMSKTLYDWQFDYIMPRENAYEPRPVIYNSWYPFEFSVNEENCREMAQRAARIGADLFVIDDGWMPGRIDDKAGLGDWVPDPVRFPNGLKPISDACHENGLTFGLWVEPEMLNPDSDLYRRHPEWVLKDEHRPQTTSRNQLILDMSREDVVQWCIGWLDRLIEENGLDYLKWDMNREVSERGLNRELSIRYMQNIYRIWKHLRERFPRVLFENCASGGGRADFGMAPFADRINRSDNADTVDVMRIHEGFSTLFPPKLAGGAGNVSPSPNGINGRTLPFDFRAASGMTGSMSVGINILRCDEEQLEEIRNAVAEFKRYRKDIQNSYVLRLRSVYDGNVSALEYLRRDGETVHLFVFGHGLRFSEGGFYLRLRKLEARAFYADESGRTYSGSYLMNHGLPVLLRGDYQQWKLRLRKVKPETAE